ncbi:MAG TPA: urate hydroxylase PuuD [Hyphomicrobiaceae bacterium]|nr:urate hydroxylase PuuD [Hyphomicrobiaceae bacterium]
MSDILWIWGEAFLRWLHVVAGIAWIGSSFYFIHLDYSLKKREGLAPEAYGEAWQVHGGGFYNMVKYLVAPARLPAELTWFKWEAYATWVSGFALVVAIYYANAGLYLISPEVLDVPPATGIALSAGGLVLGWIVYDALCRSPLGRNEAVLAATGFVLLTALAWVSTRLFSPRGAFMQMGALIGTIMAANVLMVIIPGQRKVVADLIAGRAPDPVHGRRGKQRSTHNNYLTLPVVFVMLSGHYPLAYATRWSWVIFALLLVMGGTIRHFFNLRHQGKPSPWWTWGAAAACALVIVWLSTLGPAGAAVPRGAKGAEAATAPVTFQQVEEIVISRCSMCHAADPVWRGIIRPPHGVVLDTPERIKMHARDIALAAVWSNAMPPSNVTSMTPEERQMLATWLSSRRPPK